MTTQATRYARSDVAADELRGMLRDLTTPTRHREPYTVQTGTTTWVQNWPTQVPPLLVQLRYADAPSGGSRAGSGFESRPAASLESLDTLARIDLEAARWLRDLGEVDPTDTAACVRRLGGLLPGLDRCNRGHGRVDPGTRKVSCCAWHRVEGDVRRWWAQARIVTGWDSPAWRPDSTCPECGVRRSLRIRLSERVGFCSECHRTWPSTEYQALADHVRVESELAASQVRLQQGPCLCLLPGPAGGGLAGLCPRCGSASCRWAVRVAGDTPNGMV